MRKLSGSLLSDGHAMFFLVTTNTGDLTLLSSNGVFRADLGRIQSFFLLICQSGLIFQQPITKM